MNPKILFRGQKPLSLEELQDRFIQYYPNEMNRAMGLDMEDIVFHQSPSFVGKVRGSTIEFTTPQGSFNSESGLNLQSRKDLRQLGIDAINYMADNPDLYFNAPTTQSRARLYRRVAGFVDIPQDFLNMQVKDSRRIAQQDLPYVQAIDRAIYGKDTTEALGNQALPPFIKIGDNVLAASRLDREPNPYTGGYMAHPLFDTNPDYLNKAVSNILRNKKSSDSFWL